MDHTHTRLFAANAAGAGWWIIDSLCRYGPSWQLVPPLLLACASAIGAVKSYQDAAQARRHAEERHQIELAAMKRRAYDPLSFGLDAPRN